MSDVRQRVTGESKETVAYFLMLDIAISEGKTANNQYVSKATREWILNTYAQCLAVTKGSDAAQAMADYPVT